MQSKYEISTSLPCTESVVYLECLTYLLYLLFSPFIRSVSAIKNQCLFSFCFAGSCFQFPLQVNRIPAAIKRKRKTELDTAGADDDLESGKSSRDPDTHLSHVSSGNSDLDSPSFVPVMNVLPPTPVPSPPFLSPTTEGRPLSLSSPDEQLKSMPMKPSSLTDVSKLSSNRTDESESLIKSVAPFTPPTKPGNMLYIPQLKGRLTAAVSESSLWTSRNKPLLDTTSMDFRGSALLQSPGMNMQQLVHPRKTEKVAQVRLAWYFI